MELNQAGIDLIKSFESLELTSYQDIGGVWTVGYGHTGDDVTPGLTITEAQADSILESDLQSTSDGVRNLVTSSLNDNQFSALVSFAFNLGLGSLGSSTLLRLVNASEFQQASEQFVRWDHEGSQVVPGLLRRRVAESTLFLSA